MGAVLWRAWGQTPSGSWSHREGEAGNGDRKSKQCFKDRRGRVWGLEGKWDPEGLFSLKCLSFKMRDIITFRASCWPVRCYCVSSGKVSFSLCG